ncbi:MAG: homocysteine S-methyltransferase family protein [Herbiconiux sp.]|nr:homocysteine S-methyltransferase family protein [Herbiconiux sp.]
MLVFHEGFELPAFAAFPLLRDATGRDALTRYYSGFLDLATETGLPFVFDTATWRANRDWGERLGFSPAELDAVNTEAVAFVRETAAAHPEAVVTVDGLLGPRGDGYVVSERMAAAEAADYHGAQIATFATAGVDRITALTLTYPEEAIGIVRAAVAHGLDVVPSFTVEVDGRLPDGTPLADALARLDEETGGAALFAMVNCAHPEHLAPALDGRPELARLGGLRPNASRLSHAELDEAETLDNGDPAELGVGVAWLRAALPNLRLLGGCCGTDVRHVRELLAAW